MFELAIITEEGNAIIKTKLFSTYFRKTNNRHVLHSRSMLVKIMHTMYSNRDQVGLGLGQRRAKICRDHDDDDLVLVTSAVNGGGSRSKSVIEQNGYCVPKHDKILCKRVPLVNFSDQQSCSRKLSEDTETRMERKGSRSNSYGTQGPTPIVTSGLVTGRVPGDIVNATYPSYPPSSADVPTDVPAYYEFKNSRVPNRTDREDEPLLDLTASTTTDVDHCHAASASGPDTTANRRAQRQLIFAAVVCFLFMTGELVGGAISHSLAIMTDAAHLLSDLTSFIISLFALWLARRPPTAKMSFGYFRAEIIGALISVLMIWIATGILVYLAIQRCIKPDYTIDGVIMLITAGCGLGVNILMALVLHFTGHSHSHGGLGHGHSHGGGHSHDKDDHNHSHNHEDHKIHVDVDSYKDGPLSIQSERVLAVNSVESEVDTVHSHSHKKPHKSQSNMNVRAAFIHILGDLIQSIGVCIAAILIIVEPNWKIADPICTFVFSILVLITTILILRDAIQVLMEGVPRHINLHNLRDDLKSLPHVRMAHGLHVWSLTTSQAAMAVHLCIDAGEDAESILQEASQLVRNKYNITFSTIQVEHYQPEVMNSCGRCQEPKH